MQETRKSARSCDRKLSREPSDKQLLSWRAAGAPFQCFRPGIWIIAPLNQEIEHAGLAGVSLHPPLDAVMAGVTEAPQIFLIEPKIGPIPHRDLVIDDAAENRSAFAIAFGADRKSVHVARRKALPLAVISPFVPGSAEFPVSRYRNAFRLKKLGVFHHLGEPLKTIEAPERTGASECQENMLGRMISAPWSESMPKKV